MVKRDGKWAKIEIQRPIIIGLYNHHMGGSGVDLADKKKLSAINNKLKV